jgi:hypothetical protein
MNIFVPISLRGGGVVRQISMLKFGAIPLFDVWVRLILQYDWWGML